MIAYYSLNQKEIDDFIQENKLNPETQKDRDLIAKHFYEKFSGRECEYYYEVNAEYFYNSKNPIKKHSMLEDYPCNHIRDHPLLRNDDPDVDLPFHITCCLSVLRNDKDAIEIAKDLRIYFPEDENLNYFADWLEQTSKYCYAYRLDD